MAVLFDIDGTLCVGSVAVAGAADVIRQMHGRGVACRFLTNTTRRSRAGLHSHLRGLGLPVELDDLFTAPVAAAAWLKAHGLARIAPFLPDAALADFAEFAFDHEAPDAVVVGDLGRSWDFDTLNRAFRLVLDGARLVALQKNRYWRTGRGLELDAGPFVAALEYATGRDAVVVGKPSVEFFRLAAASLDVDAAAILVVGDDIETDIAGAQAAGMRGVLVRTGKFREDRLRESGIEPDAVIDSVADVAALL